MSKCEVLTMHAAFDVHPTHLHAYMYTHFTSHCFLSLDDNLPKGGQIIVCHSNIVDNKMASPIFFTKLQLAVHRCGRERVWPARYERERYDIVFDFVWI
eukprot:m.1378156 g.1378156  ORF g.1378156 m.1378156 type:complete len:99 (-) comp24964_c2_seq30:7018-7314(-)